MYRLKAASTCDVWCNFGFAAAVVIVERDSTSGADDGLDVDVVFDDDDDDDDGDVVDVVAVSVAVVIIWLGGRYVDRVVVLFVLVRVFCSTGINPNSFNSLDISVRVLLLLLRVLPLRVLLTVLLLTVLLLLLLLVDDDVVSAFLVVPSAAVDAGFVAYSAAIRK